MMLASAACTNTPTYSDNTVQGASAVQRSLADPEQKAIDDNCFVVYSQEASSCNQSAGNDDTVFGACLAPVKRQLKACCQQRGGSATCAADAASGAIGDTSAFNHLD